MVDNSLSPDEESKKVYMTEENGQNVPPGAASTDAAKTRKDIVGGGGTQLNSHSSETYPQRNLVTFETKRLAYVSDKMVDAAKKGISLVWEHHIEEPTSINIAFVSRITDPQDNYRATELLAGFNNADNRLDIAVDTIKDKAQQHVPKEIGFDEEKITTFWAAHEAYHFVQKHRGEILPDSIHLSQTEYDNDPHEYEAWIEALHVLKKVYPDFNISFAEHPDFHTPEVSKYE